MSAIHTTAVTEVYQPKTIRLTVDTNESGTFVILEFTLPNGDKKTIQTNTGASDTATRDSIESKIDGSPDLAALFTTTDSSTDALDIIQKTAAGDFSVSVASPGGSLSITQAVQQEATRTPARYRLTVPFIPTAVSVGDRILAATTGRGGSGAYEVTAVSTSALTIDVDDTKGLLRPAADKSKSTTDFYHVDAGATVDLDDVPDNMLRAALSANAGTRVTRIADADYTVLPTDRVIVLADAAAGRTLTFGTGEDGQEVKVLVEATSTSAWALVGLEVDPGDMNAAGETLHVIYLSTEDAWVTVSTTVS